MGRGSLEELQVHSKNSLHTPREIRRHWKIFCAADKEEKGFITKEELQSLKGFACNPFALRLAEIFSPKGDGNLRFQNLLELHDTFHPQAPAEDKIAWAFALWDFDGDDKLLASDVRTGVRLLANGTSVNASNASEAASSSRAPAMFDDQELATTAQNRRQSLHTDLLNAHEISQVLQRIANEIEPMGNGISFEEFAGVVRQLPDFLNNFRLNV